MNIIVMTCIISFGPYTCFYAVVADVQSVKKTWRNIVDTRNSYKRANRKKRKVGVDTSTSLEKWSLAGATSVCCLRK